MKKRRIVMICAMLLAVLVLCSGCVDVQAFEDSQVRQTLETMLDALIADDSATAYAMVKNICSEHEFIPIFQQMQNLIGKADAYQLELLSIHVNSSILNDTPSQTTRSVYRMTVAGRQLIADITTEVQLGIVGFYLTPYESTDYYFTGTITTMDGAGLGQWLFLLLNVVSLGLTLYAIVDCCRHKIPKKPLWILLMVLGFATISIAAGTSAVRLNFSLGWLTAYSALVRYGSGTVMVRLMLPAGAISYLIARRSLLKKAAQKPEVIPDPSQAQAASTGQTPPCDNGV